jgi:hypothetical protein
MILQERIAMFALFTLAPLLEIKTESETRPGSRLLLALQQHTNTSTRRRESEPMRSREDMQEAGRSAQ